MKRNSGILAGAIAIVLSLASAIAGVLLYMNHHTRRGIAFLILFVILVVAGIVIMARSGQKGPTS